MNLVTGNISGRPAFKGVMESQAAQGKWKVYWDSILNGLSVFL